MSRTTTVSLLSWRRILLVAITALVAALAVSFGKPTNANAFVDPSIVRADFVGWGEVRASYDRPQVCSLRIGYPCGDLRLPSYKTAYEWNGRSWVPQRIVGGTNVYIYPYSGSWSWAWTQRTGWLAMQRSDLSTGRVCPALAFC